MKKAIKGLGLLVAFLILVVGGYIGTSFLTARMSGLSERDAGVFDGLSKTETVYVITGTLHADFLIPNELVAQSKFGFLSETKLPLDHPNLKYLAFGWGSKAFYTTAGSYSDITVSAAFKEITGDQSVMRVVAFGDIDPSAPDVIVLKLSRQQVDALLDHLYTSFKLNADGAPQFLRGASIGSNDAFYEGVGGFNIFHPCNQWVNQGLRKAGVEVGRWTPTTQSLRHSLSYFGSAVLN